MDKKEKQVRQKSVVRDWAESIVIALILALFIRTFVIQAFKIPTGSMRMTLIEGDVIMVNKLVYGPKIPFTSLRIPGIRKPAPGDVVVFVYPEDPTKDFIKRLVAVGGQTVEIKNGTIYVDSKPLQNALFPAERYYYNRGQYCPEGQKIKVPENMYFVLGDNSASSQDSRYWGFVPQQNMVGKALFIYWPLHRIRFIK